MEYKDMKNMENKNGPEIHIGENTNTVQKGNFYLKEMETATGENRLEAYYQNEKNKLTARLKSVDSEDKELTNSIWRDISALEEAYRIVKKGGNNKNIVNICPKCGIEYENSAKFCRKCGSLLVLMQCPCGEVFLKKEDGSFDKFCMKCGQMNPFEQAKQALAEEDRKEAEELQKEENERKHKEYINSLKAGDIIEFGSYPFEADGTEKPIEWIILERYSDDTVLLLSRYGLDAGIFSYASWYESDIRKWLNNNFYNKAFNAKEKEKIIGSVIEDIKKGSWWDTLYILNDRFFLLSEKEGKKYCSNGEWKCQATPYARSNKTATEEPVETNDYGYCRWWLRSSDQNEKHSHMYVDEVNFVGSTADYCFGYNYAVRPALKINLKKAESTELFEKKSETKKIIWNTVTVPGEFFAIAFLVFILLLFVWLFIRMALY